MEKINKIKRFEPKKHIHFMIPFDLYVAWIEKKEFDNGDISKTLINYIEADISFRKTEVSEEEMIKKELEKLENQKKQKATEEMILKTRLQKIEQQKKEKEDLDALREFEINKRRLSENWDSKEEKNYG